MKTLLSPFTLALISLAAFGVAYAETNATSVMDAHAKARLAKIALFTTPRQSWMTNYYGKTLSSLGRIDTIRITDHLTQSTPNWTHRELGQIIEESKMQDYPKGSTFI